MAKAVWNGVVLAESDATVIVEGRHYFPPDSLNRDHFEVSDHSSICPWKGRASYFHVVADGERNENAAWTYPATLEAAEHIRGYIAFWKDVSVEA